MTKPLGFVKIRPESPLTSGNVPWARAPARILPAAPRRDGRRTPQWPDVTTPLPDLLRQQGDPSRQWVEQAIFGTSEPDQIAECITGAVHDLVGVPVRGGVFYGASAGCVFGLELADDQLLVCKVYQAHWEMPFLQATQRVQRILRLRGFPCPDPIAGPVRVGRGLAALESFLPDSGMARPDDNALLERSVAGLVELIAAARGVDHGGLDRHPFRTAPGQIYPTPHSPIFDLVGTSPGGRVDRRRRPGRLAPAGAPRLAAGDRPHGLVGPKRAN
jgi:hypothetical protein